MTWSILGVDTWILLERMEYITRKFGVMSAGLYVDLILSGACLTRA